MASPSFIFFILIQSCIWRIWFLIKSLRFTTPPRPSSPLRHIPWFTLPIKPSSPLLSNIRCSLLTYWNSLGSTSQCMYAPMRGGGGEVAEVLMDLFLKNKSSVLETCNTLAIPLVCKVLSWFRHVELFFFIFQGFLSPSQTVEMYKVYKCIAKVLYAPTSSPLLGYEATCVGKVMHLRWSVAPGPASDTVYLGKTEYTP